MKLRALDDTAREQGLAVLGAFHPNEEDAAPVGTGTLVLLGPDGTAFWRLFRESAEFGDGAADPVDRWSVRAVGALAVRFDAVALYPFTGPPWHPFSAWARRSGRAWGSPLGGMLVHETAGLFVSFRGALALREQLKLPVPSAGPPCPACAAPCKDACPVGAFTATGYDAAACRTHLGRPEGLGCLMLGCAARRACPIGRAERPAAQSAFHMAAFHGNTSS